MPQLTAPQKTVPLASAPGPPPILDDVGVWRSGLELPKLEKYALLKRDGGSGPTDDVDLASNYNSCASLLEEISVLRPLGDAHLKTIQKKTLFLLKS